MANSNTTSLTPVGATDHLDRADRVHSNLRAVQAIIDAACILSALERTEERTGRTGMANGAGWANGHIVRNDTLPDMLHHARKLAENVEDDFQSMCAESKPARSAA